MALVHNNNLGVYAGVSKQAVDLRLPSHCEEMINCYPTIQYGVKRRNPSVQIGTGMFAENDTFTYAYDRGVALAEEEQYYISIDGINGLRVFDVIDQVYRTVTLTGTSATYITNAAGYRSGFAAITVKDTTIITNRGVLPTMSGSATSDYDKKAFVWIKQVSVDTAFPYSFTLTLKETNGTTIATTTTTGSGTTTGVASVFATWADAVTGFTAVADGSVVKITRDNSTAFDVIVSDTYGSQASSAWKGSIEQMADLPKLFPFKDTIVKVDGVQRNDDVAYWVKYDGNQWVEHRDPTINYVIDTAKMPHKLVRNPDFSFTMSPITWDNLLVGDNDTQSIPEFIGSPVLDMFFVNGRLGLLTRNGISLSQQGNLYNFFRTTVLALLADSAITTFIDSTRSVGLCYAIELQGLVILFGDKSQFYLDTSKALSPSTISIQPICQYEINTTLKPIFMNDSVFFVVTRSGYSSLMEMSRNTITTNVAAIDVSSHVSGYIDGNIVGLTALPRSNFICLLSGTHVNTVFTYKYHDSEGAKSQMAWGKWTFNMLLKSIFSLGNKVYFLGARYSTLVPIEDYPLVVSWDDTKIWADETFWLESAVATVNKLEYVDLDSTAYTTFLDSGTVGYPSEIELSEWSLTSTDKTKELRGNLLIKTIDVSSTDGSLFNLNIIDKERGTTRVIPSLYTVNRKPFVSGNAKNMGIKIKSTNGAGFQIKSISLEGQYNVRSKRV